MSNELIAAAQRQKHNDQRADAPSARHQTTDWHSTPSSAHWTSLMLLMLCRRRRLRCLPLSWRPDLPLPACLKLSCMAGSGRHRPPVRKALDEKFFIQRFTSSGSEMFAIFGISRQDIRKKLSRFGNLPAYIVDIRTLQYESVRGRPVKVFLAVIWTI